MTTTVRILGSRAREQLPGTSITLRAPGFRGAVTQFAGAAAHGHALPFTQAAADAEVMLAAHLSLQLEARSPGDTHRLRSRSAFTTHPRLIVPKRKGVAYALLQTDEDDVSSFVFADSAETGEAVFPLNVDTERPANRTLRVFMWPAGAVQGGAALASVSRFESQHRPNRLVQIAADGSLHAPDWEAIARGPALLLLHGTFGTPQATFDDWIRHESFARLLARYDGRCIAFAHPTMSVAPEENLAWLLANLPPRQDCLDVVAHGRGGLLARLLATDGRLIVRRVCQVGTPNLGTVLVRDSQLSRYLDGHIALLTRARRDVAEPTLQGALCLARTVGLGVPPELPGLDAMVPDSLTLRALGAALPWTSQWYTIGAQYTGAGAPRASGLDPGEFAALPNDGVVPSDGCHQPGSAPLESLKLGGDGVHHHNYFADAHVRDRLAAWLG